MNAERKPGSGPSEGEEAGRGASSSGTPPVRGARLAAVMGALMLSLLLEALDQTVVGTALPRIIGTLHGFDRYTWAVTGYLLASTTVLPLAGKLSDLFGRKWFLVGGTVTFLVGSALCGAATTIEQLIAYRVLQGLGAGIGISLVFTVVADLFPPEQRARWQGVLGSVYGLSSVAGPTLGGWLAEHGPVLGPLVTATSRWRWVFFVNLPLGVLALALLCLFLPGSRVADGGMPGGRRALRRVDVPGAVLSVAGSSLLLIGLTAAGEPGGSVTARGVLGPLLAAAACFAVFVLVERSAAEPVVPFALFRHRIFAADSALTIFLYMTLFGTAFFVPLYLQGVIGVTPTTAGIIMTPFSLSIVLGNALAGAVLSRAGRLRPTTIAGTLVMSAGVFALTRLTPSMPLPEIALLVAVTGLGMGLLFTATTVAAQNSLPPSQLGVGFGLVRYLGQIGGSLGVAVVGAVVNHSLAAGLARGLPPAAARILTRHDLVSLYNPQALLNPTLRAGILRHDVQHALAGTPPGARRTLLAEQLTAVLGPAVDQVFTALRQALDVAVRHGLEVALLCSLAACAAALTLREP